MSEEKIEVPEQNYGPGNVLRAKREEYEWSVEAVAEALHLSTHSVKAIEGDRYDELPGATYVIGYWRSYARLLGIDIEETIEVNKRNLNIVTSESAGLDINKALGSKRNGGGLGWLLLLLALAGMGYFAWTNNFWGLLDKGIEQPEAVEQNVEAGDAEDASSSVQEQVLMPLEQQPAEPEASQPAEQPAASEPAVSVEQPTTGLVLQSDTRQAATPSGGSQTGLVMSQSIPAPAPAVPVAPEQSNTQSVSAGESAPPEAPASPELKTTDAEASNEGESVEASDVLDDPATMLLTLNKDSWLDIRDKTNTRLLYKTESAGKTIKVTGTPPFYVYIGTPDGVTIQYLGKNVPFETHKSGLFARFKLGENVLESL